MNEDGEETDNEFCDQDPVDVLTMVQLNSNSTSETNLKKEKLSTLEQRQLERDQIFSKEQENLKIQKSEVRKNMIYQQIEI